MQFLIVGADMSDGLPVDPVARMFRPTQTEVEAVSEMAREAVRAGRFIDFGMLPNDVIKFGGERGGPLFNQGALAQPFMEPWLLYHRWEQAVAVYLVNPWSDEEAEICELQPAEVERHHLLLIGDRGLFKRCTTMTAKYDCQVAPSTMRFVLRDDNQMNNGSTPQAAAAGNIGDPLMCALLILNTRNVERETVEAPFKLNRARMRSRKPPIPPYDVVHAEAYVTAIKLRGQRRERSEDQGGTHASPVPHIRMGHPRHYATGKVSFIRDTLVNVSEEQRAAFKSSRSHYTVQR